MVLYEWTPHWAPILYQWTPHWFTHIQHFFESLLFRDDNMGLFTLIYKSIDFFLWRNTVGGCFIILLNKRRGWCWSFQLSFLWTVSHIWSNHCIQSFGDPNAFRVVTEFLNRSYSLWLKKTTWSLSMLELILVTVVNPLTLSLISLLWFFNIYDALSSLIRSESILSLIHIGIGS